MRWREKKAKEWSGWVSANHIILFVFHMQFSKFNNISSSVPAAVVRIENRFCCSFHFHCRFKIENPMKNHRRLFLSHSHFQSFSSFFNSFYSFRYFTVRRLLWATTQTLICSWMTRDDVSPTSYQETGHGNKLKLNSRQRIKSYLCRSSIIM